MHRAGRVKRFYENFVKFYKIFSGTTEVRKNFINNEWINKKHYKTCYNLSNLDLLKTNKKINV